MAKCNECGSEYLEGTLYCIECGSSFLSDSEDGVSGDIESTVKIPNVAAIAEIATDAEELTQPLGRLHGIGVHDPFDLPAGVAQTHRPHPFLAVISHRNGEAPSTGSPTPSLSPPAGGAGEPC